MSRAHKIVDHFTDDEQLKAKIHEQIRRAREEGATLDDILPEFTDDPALQAKIKKIASQKARGMSITDIAHHHHSDKDKAQRAAERALRHHGAVEHIMKNG